MALLRTNNGYFVGTLVEVKDGQVQLIENVSNIRRYIESIVLVKA